MFSCMGDVSKMNNKMRVKFPTNIGKKISLQEWISYGNDLQERIMRNTLRQDDIDRILNGKKKK